MFLFLVGSPLSLRNDFYPRGLWFDYTLVFRFVGPAICVDLVTGLM